MTAPRREPVPTFPSPAPLGRTAMSFGAIGAGRVGAVLIAALRAAGHTIAAVAGESDASHTRVETLLPGVPLRKPTAVARGCDILLLTVPDDALDNVVTMLVASGAIRPGQVVVHTSGRHGLDVLAPATRIGARGIAMHPAMTFTGTDVDLDRLAGCVFGVTAAETERALAQSLVASLGGLVVCVAEEHRALYHAALAHGANHLVTLVTQAMDMLRQVGSADPAATLRPLLEAALDNALVYGDAALTGPIVRGDVETVRAHMRTMADGRVTRSTLTSYVAMGRATAAHAVADGRLEPRRAAAVVEALNDSLVGLV